MRAIIHGCQWKYYVSPKHVCLLCPASYMSVPVDLKDRNEIREVVSFADFFSGGFCGWSQAVSVLGMLDFDFELIFGIDNNDVVARSYRRFHKAASVVSSYSECVRQFQFEKGNDTRSTLLFHCDFHEGWWMQFATAVHLDVLCMSCPCPAWTFPNFQDINTGVLREDGLLTIESIRRADILGAQIILFENVMTMTSHPHFPLVKAALDYYGYVMVWDKCLNLSDLCPQHRVRFLAMIVKKDLVPRVQNFQLSSWPSMPKPTLGSFGAICEVSLELEQMVRVPPAAMERFRKAELLPKSEYKKTRLSLDEYRLRGPADVFSTIMAAYSTQGELSAERIERGGLYGSLFSQDRTWQNARYLSIAEGVVLMGGVNPLHLPLERSDHWRILGNGIAVPHALVLWTNAMWFFMERTNVRPNMVDAFEKWASRRFKASTIVCKINPEGIFITDKNEVRMQSVPWQMASRIRTLYCSCGVWEAYLQMQENFTSMHALKMISANIGSESFQEDLIPMANVWSDEVSQTLPWPIALDLSHLAIDDVKSPFVVILCRSGVYIVKREPHALTRNVAFDIMCGTYKIVGNYCCPTNGAGIKLAWLEPLPQVTFVHECEPPLLMFDRTLRVCSFERGGPMANSLIRVTNMAEAKAIVNLFKVSLLDDVLAAVGWEIHLRFCKEVEHDNVSKSVSVVISPVMGRFSVPLEHMQLILATRLARMTAIPPLEEISEIDQSMMSEDSRYVDVPFYVEVKIKLSYDLVWRGFVRSDMTIGYYATKWMDAAYALCCDRELRAICRGRQRDYRVTMAEMYKDSPGLLRIHYVLDFHGGGTKEQLAHWATGRLASMLLEQGGKLDEVSSFATSMIKTTGATRVLQILDSAKGQEAYNGIKKLAEGASLSVPALMDIEQKAASKIQSWSRQRNQQFHKNLQAHQFVLQKDYFFNSDGTEAHILDRLSCQDCGVVLMDPQAARPWFTDKKLVPDELAVVVLGTCGNPNCKRFTFPALCHEDHHPVVLSGCMHQLGEKEIVVKDATPFKVNLPDVVIVSFTMWVDEWDNRTWQNMTSGPVKFILEFWKKEGIDPLTTSSPWNRFWHDGHDKPCKQENAKKVGFYVNIPNTIIENVLRKSGTNGIYAFPRTQDAGKEPRWLVIWMQGQKQEILCQTSNKSYYLGMVRSNKGLGIRVKAEDFKKAFQELKPGVQVPDRRFLPLLYKIKPVPRGATLDDVASWIRKLSWDSKVVKSLAFDTWLVASNGPPPHEFGQFNDQVVLIKKVDKMETNRSTPVLVAGPQPKRDREEGKKGTDPFVKNDPWMSWKGPVSSGPVQPRQVDPPVASKFQKYDEEIQQLHTSLEALQKDVKQSREEQTKTNDNIKARMDQTEQTFKQSIDHLHQSFSSSLQAAANLQDKQMKNGFDELKALLKMSTAHSPPKKAQKLSNGGDGMDDTEF